MNIYTGDPLDGIKIKKSLSDEFGVYLVSGENDYLAFPFSSATEAIFSGKRIAQLLKVQYNILNEVEFSAVGEQKQKTEVLSIKVDTGGSKMAKKAGNIRKIAKEMLESGKTQQEVLDTLIQSYKDLGKDEKYSNSRARVVLVSVLKKMNLSVEEGIKKSRKTKKVETTEAPESVEEKKEEAPEETTEGTDTTQEGSPQPEMVEETETESEKTEQEQTAEVVE